MRSQPRRDVSTPDSWNPAVPERGCRKDSQEPSTIVTISRNERRPAKVSPENGSPGAFFAHGEVDVTPIEAKLNHMPVFLMLLNLLVCP